MEPFDETSQTFLAWLRRFGAEISDKIALKDLRHVQAGRGVVAVQDIQEDEVLFRIPRSTVLSVENSILSKEVPKATFEHLGPWLSLIFVMLYEYLNHGASNWVSYFSVLPSEFNTLMFWEEDELAELQASAVLGKIGKSGADEMFMNELVPVIKEFASIFFSGDEQASARAQEMDSPQYLQLMHKMGSLIMAYAFDVEPANTEKEVDEEGYASEDEDEALPKGMVPLADMLNADADLNNARLFYEEEYLSMKALKPINSGDEIFNDYGPLPRSDLLRRYGYITDNYAQYDVVEIPLGLIKTIAPAVGASSLEERLQYLDEHELVESGYDITMSDPFDLQESLSPELIIVVETLILAHDEYDRLKRKGKLPKPDRLTQGGKEFLHKLVQARIQQYPTSLEEDINSSQDMQLASKQSAKDRRYAMAKAVRIGEKKILRDAEQALARVVREGPSTNGRSKRSAEGNERGSEKKQKT